MPKERTVARDEDGLSEFLGLFYLCLYVTLGSSISAVVIGACYAGLDGIVMALGIAGAISMITCMMSMISLAPVLVFVLLRFLYRRIVLASSRKRRNINGLADEWLDSQPDVPLAP